MIILSKYAVILGAALACCAAQAAQPLEVSVAGRLAPMNSCVPTLSGGDLDYGIIKASELDRDGPTFLPEKVFTVTVACQSPVNRLAISFVDHKADDAVRDTAVLYHPLCSDPLCGDVALGLGKSQQDRKIGALFLMDRGATIDNQPVNWWSLSRWKGPPRPKFSHNLFVPREVGGVTTEYSPASAACNATAGFNNAPCFVGQRFSMLIGINPVIDSKGRNVADDMRLDGVLTLEIRML